MKKIAVVIFMLFFFTESFSEYIFFKNGSIDEGKVAYRDNYKIILIQKNNIKKSILQKNILRILYNDSFKTRMNIFLKNKKTIQGYIVFYDNDKYIIRKSLNSKKEFELSRNEVTGILKTRDILQKKDWWKKRNVALMGGLSFVNSSNVKLFSSGENFTGLTLNLESLFKLAPSITLGLTLNQDIAFNTGTSLKDTFFPVMLQLDLRLWFGDAFRTIYLKAGFGTSANMASIIQGGLGLSGSVALGFAYLFDSGFIIDGGARFSMLNTSFVSSYSDFLVSVHVYINVGYVFDTTK